MKKDEKDEMKRILMLKLAKSKATEMGLVDLDVIIKWHEQYVKGYERWVNDLQKGMYINCVYCGHRYGPKENTPVSMADLLKKHVERCPKHPMSALKKENIKLKQIIKKMSKGQNGT